MQVGMHVSQEGAKKCEWMYGCHGVWRVGAKAAAGNHYRMQVSGDGCYIAQLQHTEIKLTMLVGQVVRRA